MAPLYKWFHHPVPPHGPVGLVTLQRVLGCIRVSTCIWGKSPNPDIVSSCLRFDIIPPKPAQINTSRASKSTCHNTPDTCAPPYSSGTRYCVVLGGKETSSPPCPSQPPSLAQEPAWEPGPGSALPVTALAPEEGNMPDFFAKYYLNFVTSKAAAALLGAVYIACGYCFLHRAARRRLAAEAGSRKVFLCVSKAQSQAIASHLPYGSSKPWTSRRPRQMFSQQPDQSCRTQEFFASASEWLQPSSCVALCLQAKAMSEMFLG